MRTAGIILVAITSAAVVAALLLQSGDPAPPQGGSGGGPSVPGMAPTPAIAGDPGAAVPNQAPAVPLGPQPLPAPILRTPEEAGVPLSDCIAYPDGTRLPPLNGVKKAPPINFHRLLPYTKVIGIERDARGIEWYVHENEARSTTYLDGRGVPVCDVAMEAPVMPLDPGR